MKNLLILFFIIISTLQTFAATETQPQDLRMYREEAIKYYNLGLPLSTEEENLSITQIPNRKIKAYKKDMNKAINHLLNAPITHEKISLTELMEKYAKKIDEINQKYESLEDKTEYSPIAINRLSRIGGTLDLYNVVTGEELGEVCKKYNLKFPNSVHGATIMYKYYLKKYDIELADEFYEFWITNYITKQKCYKINDNIKYKYLWNN